LGDSFERLPSVSKLLDDCQIYLVGFHDQWNIMELKIMSIFLYFSADMIIQR
jgi:hypothetical protein